MKIGLTPSNRGSSCIKVEVNWVPRSDRISRGLPTREKMVRRASDMEMVSMFLSGRASSNLVEKSINVRIHLCPAEEGGESGATRSIETRAKGSVTMGID